MGLQVARITNPKAMLAADVQALFRAAVAKSPIAGGDFDAAAGDFVDLVANPKIGVFVGVENGEFRSLCIIGLPTDRLTPYPQVIHFYNRGSKELREAMVETGRRWIIENGYARFWLIQASGHSDKAWRKTFRRAGKAKTIGSVMEVEIG